ncbi:MAG: protein phosphatase 2C domain-containing protein [Phormidesmis sp.]
MINCPNPSCQTANPEGASVCQACQSVLPHFYLWGVGDLVAHLKPGQLLNQRYVLKRDHTFLDTKPGLVPESPPDLPSFVLPYLHLSAYPVHTPRPYAVMQTPDADYVLMLESSALAIAAQPEAQVPELLPLLTECWPDAPPLRQLSWLWQIAQLWDAFQAEQVAATLLEAPLLRVDGSVLRLLELASSQTPTLADLGRFWQPLAQTAHSAVKPFLRALCEHLLQQLPAEQVAERLSEAIAICGQDQAVTYDLAVYTDQGPTRKRNEDACYPPGGTRQTVSAQQTQSAPQLLIVCDGIGGHQGGDVASKLAITTIESQLQPILANERPNLSATELMFAIEAAICVANDEISAQNDHAQRQARDRMGTTLVLALVVGADVYIAHLGDSRAYRISQYNCQQVTLDDDVASRQVRLGGSLYREVLHQPGSGSLIQALGMGSSQTLRPTVQRFVLDESCVFLLCSDGLSDSDRVEQFWQSVLRPLVVSQASTADVGKRLVDLANKYNGHDNVTVGLLNARVVRSSEQIVPEQAASAGLTTAVSAGGSEDLSAHQGRSPNSRPQTRLMAPVSASADAAASDAAPTDAAIHEATVQSPVQTKPVPKASESHQKPFRAALLLLTLAALGSLLYFLFPGLSWRFKSPVASREAAPDSTVSVPVPASPPPIASTGGTSSGTAMAIADLKVGAYARILHANIPGVTSRIPGSVDSAGASPSSGSSGANPGSNPGTNLGSNPGGSSSGAQSLEAPVSKSSQLTLYPNPNVASSVDANAITGVIPTGGIVKVLSKQTADDRSKWVQLKLCSIPSGATLGDIPAETDSAQPASPIASPNQPLNQPESVATDQPLILDVGSEGWAIESKVAAASERIKDLQPSQEGDCSS